jgi:hypothetical protein
MSENPAIIERIARTPYDELVRNRVEALIYMSDQGLVSLIDRSAEQVPPNTEIMSAAGAICLMRSLSGDSLEPGVLAAGIVRAFPNT